MRRTGRGELVSLAERLVDYGRLCGAEEIEVTVADGTDFHVDVRWGRIENLVEAGSRSVGLRVITDKKTASAFSSDLNLDTLEELVRNAVERARLAQPDECAGLPPPSPVLVNIASLRLFDPEMAAVESAKKIALALETERIALEDKRITNSYGSSVSTGEGTVALANSNGFLMDYDMSSCTLSVGLQAGEGDHLVEDSWFSSKVFFKDLDPPEEVARKAVERTVRQLRPKKIKTTRAPVVFEPQMTSWLLGFLFTCVSGTSVYHKTTFLAEKLGQRVGNSLVTVVDDGLLPGLPGTRPFDSEGVPCGRTVVVEGGILKNFLCNTYAGRKLRLPSTGNADGGGVGPNNFYLQPGTSSPESLIASMERGLILVKVIGHGLNPLTGDISRGAYGLWVEGGEVVYPVSEITLSGNLGDILQTIEAVGNDLTFQTAVSGPTIKVSELTLAGT